MTAATTTGATTATTTGATTATDAVRRRVAELDPEQLPAYVYDLAALRTHAAAVRAALPERVELYYAAKANPEAPVLAALSWAVDGYEVSSGGELAHVRAAVPDAPLAFGGPGKTPAEIAAAVDAGVHRWHVESEQELYRLAAVLADRPDAAVDVLLRVNLPVGSGALDSVALAMGGRPTPFGLDPDRAEAAVRLLTEPVGPLGPVRRQLRLRGVHAHLASGLAAPEQLALAEQIVGWSTRLAERHAFALDEVNVGGGMAVDYADPAARFDWAAFGEGLGKLLDRHPGPVLRIEPGRALTAYCGWYATEVLDVKRSHGEDFAVVRGGTHHLRTPATRGHSQPFGALPVEDWPHPWERPAVTTGRATLAGQLCTPKDVLAHAAPAAARLRTGDRVLFDLAGAYAWNISHHEFLMHPRPGFHYLDGPAEDS
ncbi:type III PLP-dependent enzyme [Kitasatospora purpeofusca]|uniref:type III PLP-dependent enzyme n=1 Tax=Kitasatospora purpeofusca TaxID=67352 RepID=UPI0022532A70|nr:type III PLP-dependent enzyme [Kitasatospora purpeofusca]MCX4756795.1 type III PLP-dependent enzyme [Kitasatospora purpeofusca]WSR35422.1 type III PLP-dependent enzyme [Kitasatospora purpeofusca]WSR43742.1 type III PLP-dependent enzyme [Kitasatospora purpeofusca]